ncbi:hypothetical protein HYPSUDRAFT_203834 [Hypholoma sublateritium FD-334 SS-4]|uniref:Uncharacterized protein n=1 Tax=Hypholoma sublateritium (strain FD-334 SS-4) TaxID=945553 RepID=A0A0D2NUW5_HYPSF|nr:hypothetical protein HYPSUDRAFT_203834 [Hypholoma sublateritium FD-334 SS-4]
MPGFESGKRPDAQVLYRFPGPPPLSSLQVPRRLYTANPSSRQRTASHEWSLPVAIIATSVSIDSGRRLRRFRTVSVPTSRADIEETCRLTARRTRRKARSWGEMGVTGDSRLKHDTNLPLPPSRSSSIEPVRGTAEEWGFKLQVARILKAAPRRPSSSPSSLTVRCRVAALITPVALIVQCPVQTIHPPSRTGTYSSLVLYLLTPTGRRCDGYGKSPLEHPLYGPLISCLLPPWRVFSLLLEPLVPQASGCPVLATYPACDTSRAPGHGSSFRRAS